jgi:hypothetical protein
MSATPNVVHSGQPPNQNDCKRIPMHGYRV